MNVLVTSELHYMECDGKIVSRVSTPSFFQRYLDVWDEVVLLGRLTKVKEFPPESYPMDFYKARVIALPDFTGPLQYAVNLPKIITITKEALKQADAIVLRNCHRISKVVYSLIQGTGRPFGMEALGDPKDVFAKGALRHPFRPLFRWGSTRDLRNMCRDADVTAYVTREAMQRRYPPTPGRFTTHYSSIVLKEADFVNQPRTQFGQDGRFRLISIGTFATHYKGQDLLLEAMATAVKAGLNLHADFIGDGKHRANMEQLAVNLGLDDCVTFHGQCSSGPPIYNALDKADLFIMSSRAEGLPRVVIEAMARGVPVIGSDVGGIPELVSPDNLFPVNDSSKLATKLIEVVKDPARLAAMSVRGLQVAGEYQEPILRERRIQFYRRLRQITEEWQQRTATASSGRRTAELSAER